jgi:hypothetical protein
LIKNKVYGCKFVWKTLFIKSQVENPACQLFFRRKRTFGLLSSKSAVFSLTLGSSVNDDIAIGHLAADDTVKLDVDLDGEITDKSPLCNGSISRLVTWEVKDQV